MKPYREKVKEQKTREQWWSHERPRPELYAAIRGMERVLFHPFVSKYLCFTFVPTGIVYAAPNIIIALSTYSQFAVLQSSLHEAWAHCYCSTLETRMRYAPSDLL